MTREEVAEVVARTLDPKLAAKPGAVLFSGPGTIAPSRFYLMGLNPGGDPTGITTSITDALAPMDGASAYTDECWNKNCDGLTCTHLEDGRVLPEFRVRHQRNMIRLAKELGHDTPAALPSANAIFACSERLATLVKRTCHTAQEWWEACWPVHQSFPARVQPRTIITLGYGMQTSAFGLLRRVAERRSEVSRLGDEGRRGGWTFQCTLPLAALPLDVQVIGVPHPSYYEIGERLAEELRKLAGASPGPVSAA